MQKRLSVQSATASLSAASAASPERSERRLSRLSASEFDTILQSDETLVLAGRDESQLGSSANVPSSPSSSAETRYASRTSPPTSPSKPNHGTLRYDSTSLAPPDYRRSMARASSPDLASSARFADSPFNSDHREAARASLDSDRSAPPTPIKDELLETGAQRRVSQAQMTFSARRQSLGEYPRSQTTDTASHVSAKMNLPPALDPNPPLRPRPPPAQDRSAPVYKNNTYNTQQSSRISLAPDIVDRGNRASMIFVDVDDSHRSTFSNTMRRTSRFFKRLGGGGSSSSAPTNKADVPRAAPTPIAQAFQSSSREAPTDSRRPSNAGVSGKISQSHSQAQAQSRRPSTAGPARPTTPKKDVTPLPVPTHSAPGEKPTLEHTVITDHDETPPGRDRRSDHSATSPNSLSVPSPDPASKRLSRTEEDRLLNELQRWKLDENGILIGDRGDSPLAKRSSAARKRLEMPSFSADEKQQQGGPSSQPWPNQSAASPRKASWHGEATPIARDEFAEPVVTQRSNSLPPTPSVASLARVEDVPVDETPSIRVVTPVDPLKDLPTKPTTDPALGSPTMPIQVNGTTRDGASNSLGLETIVESAHSRDNSLATPTRTEYSPKSSAPLPSFALSSSPSPVWGIPTTAIITGNHTHVSSTNASGSAQNHPLPRTPTSMSTSRSTTSARLGLDPDQPLEEQAKVAAQRCWEEDPNFLEPKKIAEWLGSNGDLNAKALENWCNYFDFNGIRLDIAFRRLCDKLFLKGETQQVDRILAQFSRRYFDNNPQNVYGSTDVVHAVAYSLLLLNTDLHIVDTTTRMTRQQFVRNTLSAISAQSEDPELPTQPALLFKADYKPSESTDNVFGGTSSTAEATKSSRSLVNRDGSIVNPQEGEESASALPSLTNSPVLSRAESPERFRTIRSESTLTLNSSRSAEAGLESLLKEMYSAIKAQPIFQPQSSSTLNLPASHSRSSLSLSPGGTSPYATWSGGMHRSASRRSATSTMSAGSSSAYKRSSVRGFGSLLNASSSLELPRSSSPTPSAATSIDDEKYSTAYGSQSQHQSRTIGFANSLSHTIIREQHEDDGANEDLVDITEEELALLGAPWAKEGLLQRKHYWESTGKRAKEKSWLQAFFVISAGQVKMFRFDLGSSSRGPGGGMGGGDWTTNAQSVGEVSLIHALCSAMPPPGYSRERPHCFVLTLPTGGSYFFQAGTQDLVAEWVSTCNYWSARLSKEPLSGGVSNMEYGWNRAGANEAESYALARDDTMSIRSGHSRRSYQHMVGGSTPSSNPNDRITINDWKPPNVPTGACQLSEDAQLENLKRHLVIVRQELTAHNSLRAPMTKLYSPRSANGSKAAANWERKSQYLLAEVVKYQTYVDALTSAIKLRGLKRGQKEVEMMLKEADTALDDDEDLAMIPPTDGPPLPLVPQDQDEENTMEPRSANGVAETSGEAVKTNGSARAPKTSMASVTTDGEEQEYLDA